MSVPLSERDAPRPAGGALVILRWLPAAVGAVVGLSYFGAAMLGARWTVPDLRVTPVWPAAGVAAALLATLGLRWWPAIAVAALLEPLLNGIPLVAAAPLSAINTSLGLAVGWAIRSDRSGAAPWVDRPSGVLRLLVAALAASAVAALLGTLVATMLLGVAPAVPFATIWRTWWLADALGVVLVAPLLLAWLTPQPLTTVVRGSSWEALLLTLGTFGVVWFIFLGPRLAGRESQAMIALVVPFVVWASVRFGLRGGASIAALISVLTLLGLSIDPVLSTGGDRSRTLLFVQSFSAVLLLTGCVLGGAVSARDTAETLAAGRDDQIRRLVTAVPSVLFRFRVARDGTLEMRFLSDGAERIVGVPVEQLERDFAEASKLVADDDRARVVASIGTAVAQRAAWASQFRIITPEGAHRWIRGQSAPDPLPLADGSRVWNGVLTDITAEQSAEIFETEQRRVLEALATGTSRADALELIVRLLEGQLPGAYGAVWLLDADTGCMHVGAAPRVPEALIRAADGTRVAARESLAAEVLATGERVLIADMASDPRGHLLVAPAQAIGVRAAFLVPILGRGGRPLGAVSSYFLETRRAERRDIAMLDAVATLTGLVVQRFDADRARRDVEDQLEQAQRMESLGRLAGGIAHDFNNLLTVITNSAVLLESEVAPGSEPAGDVALIRHSTARAAGLVRQLLAFGRRQPWQPTALQLGGVVHGLEPVIRGLLGERHAMELDLDAEVPDVLADGGQMEQVIVNLVMNARDAMEQRPGCLTIRVEPLGEAGVRLLVRDTGVGMTPEVRARIFEPFFTTKPVGQGTGLGLSMVFAIVERSGGALRVESEPEAGASFLLEWPDVRG